MTYDPHDIRKTMPTQSTHIQTTSGEIVGVESAGNIELASKLKLQIFLLLSRLLSNSQLSKKLNCIVLITSCGCIVQDAHTE